MSIDDVLNQLPAKLRKAYRTGDDITVERIPLASAGLNRATGGGLGKGKTTLLYGGFSSGKSALSLQTIAKNQRENPEFTAAWIDTENSWTTEWAERLGVDTSRVLVIQKSGALAVSDYSVPLINNVDLLVIDSISQIIPAAFTTDDGELKGMDDRKAIGAQAKSITNIVNALNYDNSDTAVLLLSQTTTDLSGMYPQQVPMGGKKVMFASSTIIKLTSSNSENKQIKGNVRVGDKIVEKFIGRPVQALVEKNKLGKPFERASYDLYYDGDNVGIDFIGEVVDEAIEKGIIVKAGAWMKYGDQNIQGRDKVIEMVREDEDMFNELQKLVEDA